MILKIAWRNLWRRTRRTVLTMISIALGLALLLVSVGLGDGVHYQMIDASVRMGSGHVLIQPPGYHETGEVDLLIGAEQLARVHQWLEANRDLGPIEGVLNRVFVSGLASSADGSTGAQIIGLEPAAERAGSIFHKKITEGRFLEPGDEDLVVLGQGVARKLEVVAGRKMVLMAQGAGSEIESILVRVVGIIQTGADEVDQALALIPLTTAQRFLNLGDSVHQVAVLVSDERSSRDVAELGKQAFPGLEVLSWDEALPELRDFIRIDDGGNYVFHLIIFLIIAFTIMNTLLMSVLERTRELSLLDALGLTPVRRFVMVLAEALFIGVLSGAAGLLLAYFPHRYFAVHGLPLDLFYSGDFSAAGVALDPIMYSYLSFNRVAGSVLLILALTVLLSVIPAIRASRGGDIRLLGSS